MRRDSDKAAEWNRRIRGERGIPAENDVVVEHPRHPVENGLSVARQPEHDVP